jgi:hypothetical protein
MEQLQEYRGILESWVNDPSQFDPLLAEKIRIYSAHQEFTYRSQWDPKIVQGYIDFVELGVQNEILAQLFQEFHDRGFTDWEQALDLEWRIHQERGTETMKQKIVRLLKFWDR